MRRKASYGLVIYLKTLPGIKYITTEREGKSRKNMSEIII